MFYPDIEKLGSLVAVLQKEADLLGLKLNFEAPFGTHYANIMQDDRHSQIMLAKEERSFSCDFWCQGVNYGHGWFSNPKPLIKAVYAPFISMGTLCFSRTTGYPYTTDCPSCTPVGEGKYDVDMLIKIKIQLIYLKTGHFKVL